MLICCWSSDSWHNGAEAVLKVFRVCVMSGLLGNMLFVQYTLRSRALTLSFLVVGVTTVPATVLSALFNFNEDGRIVPLRSSTTIATTHIYCPISTFRRHGRPHLIISILATLSLCPARPSIKSKLTFDAITEGFVSRAALTMNLIVPHWAVKLYFFIIDGLFTTSTGMLSCAVTQYAHLDLSKPFATDFALLKQNQKASLWLVLPVTLSIVISSLRAPGNLNQAANLSEETGTLMRAYGHVRDLLAMEIGFEELQAQGVGTWFGLVQCIGYGLLHPPHAVYTSTALLAGGCCRAQ